MYQRSSIKISYQISTTILLSATTQHALQYQAHLGRIFIIEQTTLKSFSITRLTTYKNL